MGGAAAGVVTEGSARSPKGWRPALCAMVLAGCAAEQAPLYPESAPPMVLATPADTGGVDLRATYRATVCPRLPADSRPCGDVLLRLAGEGHAAALPDAADLARRYRIGFVPGFLAECFDDYLRPFTDAERELRANGFDVTYFQVSGRGTAAQDAQRLAERLAAAKADPRPLILFAHSKGLLDVLELVVSFPDEAKQIAAIVSVAGAANGSPLADSLAALYRRWVAGLPLPGCEAGDGNEIEELRRDVRIDWWRRHRDRITIPVFTLVAAPEPERISPAARSLYRRLAEIEPRNDGRLIWYDQIVPGSGLLGYVNADHWGIASAVSEAFPALGFLVEDDVPRTALIAGAIEVVAATLATEPRAGGPQ
jgi:hypothetical protein